MKIDEFWSYLEELDDLQKRESDPKGMDDERTRRAMFDPRFEEK